MISWIIAWICAIYFMNGTVVDLEDDDVVVIETDDGNVWAFSGNGYEIGDNVTVQFNDNGTETVEDDRITHVYKEKR